ncbi:MAG: metal-dependent transcriptional regulator [Flavobacteriaceae bacterium]|nr:metal-dependent transcriptional regulator [Flavobacteriaceae bacterium]
MFSQAEENYIKAIYALDTKTKKGVSTNLIAEKMQTKASSVTDMLQKLSEKRLVIYKKYQGVQLSTKGKKIAASVVRKHRLWETFLVNKLNFSWDEVHDIAEQLEHIKSEKLIDELAVFLENPTHDPHGDPIPDKNGELPSIEKIILATLQVNESGICVGVQDSSSKFLQFLDKQGIALGQKITVIAKEPFDDSLTIKIENRELSISQKIAHNLYVQLK